IATVFTSTRSGSLMYVSTEIPSRPMITAAIPPSMLSTTFLSVSANKFHLCEDGTRAASEGPARAPSNHMVDTTAGHTSDPGTMVLSVSETRAAQQSRVPH